MAGFVGAGAIAGNNTVATQAISSHASTAIGDILIAQIINKSVTANVTSPPDGTWTKLVEGTNNAVTPAHRHQYTIFWKKATVAGAQSYTFTKTTDDNVLFAGVISSWRNVGLDATALATSVNTVAADLVAFPAFDPTSTSAHVIYFAFYGLNATTFGSMAGSNPTCTTRYDLESATGTFCTLSATSGDSTGAAITSRNWASASTTDAGNTGVVLALTTLETVPVTAATVTYTGKTVGEINTETVPVTAATVSIAGQTVDIPADAGGATSGSDDVRFASSQSRLNVRRGLLYRSQQIAAPIVSAPSADITPVLPATVVFTGQPVSVLDTEPITKATIVFDGETISIGDTTLPGNDDVQFASSQTRLNVRRGLLYRPFTVPGRPTAVVDTVPVTQGTVLYTSRTVTVRETDVTPVLKATVSYTGKSVTETETVAILKAAVSFAGKTVNSIDGDRTPVTQAAVLFSGKTVLGVETGAITKATVSLIGKLVSETETIPITKATVTVVGKTVTIRESEVTPVLKGTVTFTGKPVLETEIIPILKGTVTFAGQTIATVDPGVDRITVDAASILFTGKGVFEREVLVTKGSVLFTGKPVTVIDLDVIDVNDATVFAFGKTVTVRDSEVTPVTRATVLFTGRTVTVLETDRTPVLKAAVQFSGQAVTLSEFAGETVPIGKANILFSGQTVTVTDTGGEVPVLPGGGGGVSVPPWRDYGRKKRRRYRALEEIEARLDKKIEALKAETKQTQEKVAEVMFQAGQTGEFVPFNLLLLEQTRITALLLDTQKRAERVRQEKIELARLAQIAAFEQDEEEAITMLLLT